MRAKRGWGASALLMALVCSMVFVLPVWAEVVPLPIDDSPGMPPQSDGYQGDLVYEDPSIRVTIEQLRDYGTDYWVARITLQHPSQLRTASAAGFDSQRTIDGLVLARRMRGVLSINGDYFSYNPDGFLVRQGQSYRNQPNRYRDLLLIDAKGDFHLVLQNRHDELANFAQGDIINSFNFGPALVVNGERVKKFWNNGYAAHKPRQRIGIAQVKRGSLEYLAIVSAGPGSRNSAGMTIEEFSNVVMKLGVESAYNLDGGNSTMLMFNDGYVNADQVDAMREISDIIYFASAWKPDGQ